MSQQVGLNPRPQDHQSNALTTRLLTAAAELMKNLWYLCTVLINVYVASPDPNPRGGGKLPNPNECNSTLMSGTRGIYPNCYILMLMSGVTGYEFATGGDALNHRKKFSSLPASHKHYIMKMTECGNCCVMSLFEKAARSIFRAV